MKLFLLATLTVAFVGSAIHPFGPVRQQDDAAPLLAGSDPAAMKILERACLNCHSERTQWPWYSRIAPISWIIEHDVAAGRRHMNLSQWGSYSAEERRERLAQIGVMVRTRQMPPAPYLMLHKEARITDAEIQVLYKWARGERARVE